MSEEPTTALRPKRRPKYHASEDSAQDNTSYSRVNYAKLNAPSFGQDYKSPAVLQNQAAKLLVKFINKSNKSFRERQRELHERESEAVSMDLQSKGVSLEESEPNPKKTKKISKSAKGSSERIPKKLLNFKGIQSECAPQFIDQSLKANKTIGNANLPMSKESMEGAIDSQLSKIGELESSDDPTRRLLFLKSVGKAAHPSTAERRGRTKNKDQKPFLRASYHIAIAYHIHLNNLKMRGIVSGNEINPTYPAKLVKDRTYAAQ